MEKYHGTNTFLTEALTLEAIDAVQQSVEADEPFYLYFAHYAVHAPFNSDPRFAPNYPTTNSQAAFATLIEGMDKSLGDMLAALDRLEVADNTLVFFLGDNGSDAPRGPAQGVGSSAPLRGKKATHYEGGTRVPFIAAWARADAEHPYQQQLPILPGSVQTQMGVVYDLFPTILDVLHIEPPAGHVLDGSSLRHLLLGEADPEHATTFLMHYPHDHRSSYFTTYRDGDWKVAYHYRPEETPEYELYNLKQDPYESTDLSNTNPAELTRLMTSLISAMKEQQALYPVGADKVTELLPQLP